MRNNKLISVVMSVFNNEQTLSKSIESILEQSNKNFEFLIMDDASTDESKFILKSYEKQDSKIKIFSNKNNLGLTKSLNILIKNSNGFYIARQDADDTSFADRFENQLFLIKKNNLDFCTTRAVNLQNGKLVPKYSDKLPKKFLINFKNPFVHGTLLIKKRVLFEIGLYDENFYYAQDYKLFYDLIKNNYKYKVLKKPKYYLNTSNNISTKFYKEQSYYAKCVKSNITPNAKAI